MADTAQNDKNLRLLVVSNRLPVTVNKDADSGEYNFKMSSGGLVAALSGLKKMMSFTWIGWPGKFKSVSKYVGEKINRLTLNLFKVWMFRKTTKKDSKKGS
jgi:trehalose-6-phosphate synthase